MKKRYMVLLIVVVIIGAFLTAYLINVKKRVRYYTYDGEYVMSSNAIKVYNYKELERNYFIKETASKAKSKTEVIEMQYSSDFNAPYLLYGYYTVDEFKKYFAEDIKNGLVCDGKKVHYHAETSSFKCIKHKAGFKYEKIDSEVCAVINEELICVKANDWKNNKNYKKMFENIGWKCEYTDYSTGKHSDTKAPKKGIMECSKTKPSIRNQALSEEMFFDLGTDGSAIFNDHNTAYCSINADLSAYCFGIE